MDKNQGHKLFHDIFSQPFNLVRYRDFLQNLLNRFESRDAHYVGNLIPDAFKQHINQYWRIGKYVDPNGDELDLLVVEVKNQSKLERARSVLRNFAVDRLKRFEKEASLIAFYAKDDGGKDWRFSYVKIEYEAYKDFRGKVKINQELTPAKRYSYLVGVHENSHTAAKQLLPVLLMDYADPHIEEIEAAFSIEKVSNDFFDQYKSLFQNVAKHLKTQKIFQQNDEKETDQAVSRFSKKLLGQIVFLYFLQKKGWLGVSKDANWGKGDRRFMRNRFDNTFHEGGEYFNDFLKYLFYDALAKERKDGMYDRFNCKIPFLNGGLFEADYDWQNNAINLPNDLFHNAEKNKAGDRGTGILDVFDRYNFTIKEDEPLDKEVAIDPEMLGKVFENMLEITERKNSGAFYTPREIVHYMCQESLIHYLDNTTNNYNKTYQEFGKKQIQKFGNEDKKGQLSLTSEHSIIKVPREDLALLIRNGHQALEHDQRILDNKDKKSGKNEFRLPESVRKSAAAIDHALSTIKVCDPAIGSGAFPVGLLHEIVSARLALAPHIGNNNTPYDLKRHAIRESIYGVDIDSSAIDIARLRLWLSLIVDEDRYDEIEALPNLDYKIVQGDSLVGMPKGVSLYNANLLKEIRSFQAIYRDQIDEKEKKILRKKINRKIRALLDSAEEFAGYKINFDFELYFSEVWHEKGGFDVIIGNPPYVQIQKFSGQQIQKDWEKQNYRTFTKTGDIYCLFYEKGYQLLRENGTLAFITSNKWMRANYGKKLRLFFSEKTAIKQLIDFGDSPIFSEATTYTNVMLFSKCLQGVMPKVWDLTTCYQKNTSLLAMIQHHGEGFPVLEESAYIIVDPQIAAIKKRIEVMGVPLKDWNVSINRGVLTGFNEAFIINGKTKNELIAADPKSAEILKPILRGRDIKRYRIDYYDLWLIATFPALNLNIDNYPAIKSYLKSFGRKLNQTGEVIGTDEKGDVRKSRKKTDNMWFETQDQIAYYREFAKEKIVWPETSVDNQLCLDEMGFYLDKTCFFMVPGNKYLLAILNSMVAKYYLALLVSKMRGGYFSMSKIYIEKVPIIKVSIPRQQIFIIFVDYIQCTRIRNNKLESAFFEQLIDGLVYELYFPDEIKAAGKEMLIHLGELKALSNEMSEEDKMAIIQQAFDRLYDPAHPIRNHIETLDSVNVVRTIRKALRK